MLLIPFSELHIWSATVITSITFVFPLFSLMERSTEWLWGSPAQVHGLFKLKTHEESNSADPATHAKVYTTAMQCHILQFYTYYWNALNAGHQNARDTQLFVQYFQSSLKVTEKGITEHAWDWTLATEFGRGFRASSNLDPLIPHILEKNSIAYLLLHFMQVVRIFKKNKCSLAQKHQEVSVFGLWALQFSPLFYLGWLLCYSEVEGGREIIFFHLHCWGFRSSPGFFLFFSC